MANHNEQPWKEAVDLIHRSDRILAICHVSPDGDAVGSLLGLGLVLKSLGKTPTLACESPVPSKFSFLPGFAFIASEVREATYDLVIGLDSSDPMRLGNVYQPERLGNTPLLNIDHHVTNLYYGDVNVVDTDAGSTAEMVLTLIDYLGIPVDEGETGRCTASDESNIVHASADPSRETGLELSEAEKLSIATCLLTGIVTDTMGFRTANVTPRVMQAAMRLMNAGASLAQVTHYAFNQRPLVELRLLALGLDRMHVADGLAWSELTLADRAAVGLDQDVDIGLVGTLVRTQEVQIAVVFTEKEDTKVEIGFRADPGFDVAQLALSLGGGGHPAASGCTIEGPLEVAKARVLPLARAVLDEQRRSKDVERSLER